MTKLARLLPALVIAFGLMATALGVLVFRYQERAEYESHYSVSWALHKATSEVGQFLKTVVQFTHRVEGVGRDEVQLRHEILLSRLDMMSEGEVGEYMARHHDRRALLRDFAAAIGDVDAMIARLDDDAVVAAIYRRILPFESLLGQLASETYAADATRNSEYWIAMHEFRSRFQIVAAGLALSGALLGWKTLRQQRRIREANGELGKLAAELQRALAAEREINAQQRQFVSMASHEFRTPLAIIDGACQRLMVSGADVPKRVERIRSAVARMVQIIDRTLSTAQLEAGRVEFAPERCDLGALLREVCERQRGIAQRFEIALELPPREVIVDADRRLLDQAFTNLLANAVKYSGASHRIEVVVGAVGARAVEVSVRDHGIGIPASEFDRLFTRFYRASTALTVPGTGIGLHLVKQFVSLHGGEIAVASEVGRGSTFTVRLPLRQPAAEPERERAVA